MNNRNSGKQAGLAILAGLLGLIVVLAIVAGVTGQPKDSAGSARTVACNVEYTHAAHIGAVSHWVRVCK